MKKIVFILFVGITGLNLVGCLPKGLNKDDLVFPAVVSYNNQEGLRSMLTVAGEFAAPELDLESGECILTSFTLDWDEQPANSSIYYASNIQYVLIEQSNADIQNDFDETEIIVPEADLLPIKSLVPQTYRPILNGKYFVIFSHPVPSNQEMAYKAIVKQITPGEPVANVYIIGEKTNKAELTNIDTDNLYVFDMSNAINVLGKDTTYRESSVDFTVKQLKINLKYCIGLDEDGLPEYKDYTAANAITLSLYKSH
jgi:hypothetical protein